MKKDNFILLTEVSDHNSTPSEGNIIINSNCISTIYKNADNNTVIVMNHIDFENQENFKKNYPKRVVVKESFMDIKKIFEL